MVLLICHMYHMYDSVCLQCQCVFLQRVLSLFVSVLHVCVHGQHMSLFLCAVFVCVLCVHALYLGCGNRGRDRGLLSHEKHRLELCDKPHRGRTMVGEGGNLTPERFSLIVDMEVCHKQVHSINRLPRIRSRMNFTCEELSVQFCHH